MSDDELLFEISELDLSSQEISTTIYDMKSRYMDHDYIEAAIDALYSDLETLSTDLKEFDLNFRDK